jgi:two-component system sensor histidine kinase GlrK
MLDNLVSNAAKFSPEQGVIEISVQGDGRHMTLEVADSGPGIPPVERERVFDPFYRGRSVAVGALRGSGIGLSVVRDYAQAHGGRVEVVDTPERQGARLRVTLPLQQGTLA